MEAEPMYEPASGFHVPVCYGAFANVGLGAFGHFCRAQVDPTQRVNRHAYFEQLEGNAVNIKQLLLSKVKRDCYHAKQVYREIVILKQIRHENLIKFVDAFVSPTGDFYVVTEAVDCELSRIISPSFDLIPEHVRYIMYGILRGLNYLHSAGILHRDIKPSNIFVNSSLDARIGDFGLARLFTPDTLATGYVTTRWYRAPEVMLTREHYTSALDIWGELLNRLRGHVTRNYNDPVTGALQPLYALFPADHHLDHIAAIIKVLGPPPAHVIESTADPNVHKIVQRQIKLLEGQTTTLPQYLGNVDAQAVSLAVQLLNFDPRARPSTAMGLAHPYLSKYHDPQDELTRPPLDRHFERLELPLDMWLERIKQEVRRMDTVLDGSEAAAAAAAVGDAEAAAVAMGMGSMDLFDGDQLDFKDLAGLETPNMDDVNRHMTWGDYNLGGADPAALPSGGDSFNDVDFNEILGSSIEFSDRDLLVLQTENDILQHQEHLSTLEAGTQMHTQTLATLAELTSRMQQLQNEQEPLALQ